jgi:dipeptidase E
VPGHIVAMGGGGFMGGTPALDELVLSLARRARPRVCFLGTATGDNANLIVMFMEAFGRLDCEPVHLRLFGAPERPAEEIARADVVYVGGGNTANLLAVWRVHGVDRALREAWERGAVLGGVSAGANCWFEASVTDSFGVQLDPLRDGLGLLAGSFCPHFDGEERRRPVYTELVRDGFPEGCAADDHAALVFEGPDLREIVSVRDGATAYRVTRAGVEPLEARRLS